jgi:hypothetical protein
MKARAFISCGQNQLTDEVEVAQAIAARLDQLGYDPYIAVQEQTLRGLVENIFGRLAASEYLVFVDFKREQFANSPEHRGSLFSHQELAVAAFLELDVVAFQESGVRQLDGMVRFVQANAIRFSDRSTLPDLVAHELQKRGWRSDWRRTLKLERDPSQSADFDAVDQAGHPAGCRRFFHGVVYNQHRSLVAAHTYVYLDRITHLGNANETPLKTIELKWAGYTFPNAVVRPGTKREFDCCWIHHDHPSTANFNVFSDSTMWTPVIHGPGKFILRFTAVADRFAPESIDMLLTLGASLGDARLVPA